MNDKEPLRPKTAFDLCEDLRLLPKFKLDEKRKLIANKLIELCVGGYLDERYFRPEQQAKWLINRMVNSWSSWEGPAGMRELLQTNFTAQPPYDLGSKPKTECSQCDDSGFDPLKKDRCICLAGSTLDDKIVELCKSTCPTRPVSPNNRSSPSVDAKLTSGYGFKKTKTKAYQCNKRSKT